MGVHFVFHFILLLWLIQAAASQQPDESDCMEECGGVQISPPFGIKTGCYNNSWFKVTCNKTANGQKPFISRIKLEIYDWISSGNEVTVKIPVTSVNCSNNDNNGVIGTSNVNLTGTPFFFSSRFNLFGSIGCGNLVTISHNQTAPLGGCMQPRCGDDLSSEAAGCLGLIPEYLTSYTVQMEAKDSKRSCTSAFVFDGRNVDSDFAFPNHITKETEDVFATLEWNPVDCDLEESLCQKQGEVCEEKCGNVDIPYPFGKCSSKNDWFRVTCNETKDGLKPFISSINLELLNVSFSKGSVLIHHPVTHFNSSNKDNNGISANLTGSPFFFSNIQNAFWSSGCGNLATVFRNPADTYPIAGCLQPGCGNIETSSNAGCRMMVPPDLSSFVANMTKINASNGHNRPDGSTFLIDTSYFNENMTIKQDRQEISNWTHVETTLQWGIPQRGLCEVEFSDPKNYNCSSDGRYCWSNISSKHLCVCSLDFNDDYYFTDICRETHKCQSPYNYCYMLCLNTPGNYCSSTSCPDKYKYASEEDRCVPRESSTFSKRLAIIIGCSTSIGTTFVLLGSWSMYKVLKRRKNTKLKRKYYERNGGLLLQQPLSSNEGNVEKIRVFTSKELEKATDHYNKNRILGQGGQGTVYKGMLADGSIVAIKKPKLVEEKKIDEKKLEQFINEVMILSQISHRNVVKLLGCCLESEVPLLVYEFIPNGTLSQLIHDQNDEFPMTWKMRLGIAIEIANALCYLHSAASVPIYHRDIKSSNILLDDKYRAKVSDFGISRSVALEKTHLTTQVQGTFGYLDPEYFRSSHFTEKSDVYSFGVVLVELLTGQKPISSKQSEEVRSLVNFFLLTMRENSLYDILDQVVLNDGPGEEITAVAKLAKRCLNLNGKKRPTMKQVAMELERIEASEEANAIQQSTDEDSDIDDLMEPSDFASCSTSASYVNASLFCTQSDYVREENIL